MERKTLVEDCYILCGCKRDNKSEGYICDNHKFILKHYISDIASWRTLNDFCNLLIAEKDDEYNRVILKALIENIKYSGIAKLMSENPYVISILRT